MLGAISASAIVVLAAVMAASAHGDSRAVTVPPAEKIHAAAALYPDTNPRSDPLSASRVFLTDPSLGYSTARFLYYDGSIKGYLTSPYSPEQLVLFGYLDRSERTASDDCGYAILEPSVSVPEQELRFAKLKETNIGDEDDTLFCGEIDRLVPRERKGVYSVKIRRFVLDRRGSEDPPPFVEESYTIDFSGGKPELAGKIERCKSGKRPSDVLVYLEYANSDKVRIVRNYVPAVEPITCDSFSLILLRW